MSRIDREYFQLLSVHSPSEISYAHARGKKNLRTVVDNCHLVWLFEYVLHPKIQMFPFILETRLQKFRKFLCTLGNSLSGTIVGYYI